MSRYLVISNETNQLITVIDWDGVTPIFDNLDNPPNYRYELETTSSYNTSTDYTASSDFISGEPTYAGEFSGYFDGEIATSTLFNGRYIQDISKDTEYGRMYYQGTTNDFFDKIDTDTKLSSSFFAFNNENDTTEIFLTLTNNDDYKLHNYSSSLSRILTDNLSNFVFKLQSDQDTSFMEYFVSNAELSSSLSGKKYVKLSVSQSSEHINNIFKTDSTVDYDLLLGTDWNINFDFGDKTRVGTFYGDFNGTIGGKKVEDILKDTLYAGKARLAFNSTTTLEAMEVCPPALSFRFPTDPIDWTQPINRVTLNFFQYYLDGMYNDATFYSRKLLSIINDGLDSQILVLRSQEFPNTYKKLKIINGTCYFNKNLSQPTDPNYDSCLELNWGMKLSDFFDTNNLTVSNDCNRFVESNYLAENQKMWPDFYNENPLDPFWSNAFGYFDLEVEEIESNYEWYKPSVILPSGILRFEPELPTVQPSSGDYDQSVNDLFLIEFDTLGVGVKKKEVFEFTSTRTPWTVPNWADKITIYAIGAGGGGGGGSTGWGHDFLNLNKDPEFGKDYYRVIENLTNDGIGFEFATGGGGGGGGNIAISEFLIDKSGRNLSPTNIGQQLLPKQSKLNIYVGSGGKGGIGLTNNPNDYETLSNNDAFQYTYNRIRNNQMNWIVKLMDSRFPTNNFSPLVGEPNSIIKAFYLQFSSTINYGLNKSILLQIGNDNSFGKKGGFSSVVLDQSSNNVTNVEIELVNANGGFGGMNGISLQFAYDAFHRFCTIENHFMTDPLSLGGGSSFGDSVGNVEILPGGHGGYGVSMPNISQVTNDKIIDFKIEKILTDNIDSNIAADIPWSMNNRINIKTPIGSTYLFASGEAHNTDGYKKYDSMSTIKPQKLAPLGGNGGLGVNYQGIENRSANLMFTRLPYYSDRHITKKFELLSGGYQTSIPNDWFKWTNSNIAKNIIYGNQYRPTIHGNNTLISTNVTAVNGVPQTNYEFKLKNTGALGGLNIYKCTDGTDMELTAIPLNERVPTQPESGDDYGQGGGGGAAAYTTDWSQRATPIQGQNGGDGANGIVIIIVEQL